MQQQTTRIKLDRLSQPKGTGLVNVFVGVRSQTPMTKTYRRTQAWFSAPFAEIFSTDSKLICNNGGAFYLHHVGAEIVTLFNELILAQEHDLR
jgi:hypothetical protein